MCVPFRGIEKATDLYKNGLYNKETLSNRSGAGLRLSSAVAA